MWMGLKNKKKRKRRNLTLKLRNEKHQQRVSQGRSAERSMTLSSKKLSSQAKLEIPLCVLFTIALRHKMERELTALVVQPTLLGQEDRRYNHPCPCR